LHHRIIERKLRDNANMMRCRADRRIIAARRGRSFLWHNGARASLTQPAEGIP
jgi:hypothetical protein